MTIQEFAKMLDGREMGNEMTSEDKEQARELGFVVVYGYSDDNAELQGAIRKEVGCFDGGTIYLDNDGRFLEECECECSYYQLAKEKCKLINIIWHDEGGPAWTYETEIPHATFDVMEAGEVWCRGIVFDIKSLGE